MDINPDPKHLQSMSLLFLTFSSLSFLLKNSSSLEAFSMKTDNTKNPAEMYLLVDKIINTAAGF